MKRLWDKQFLKKYSMKQITINKWDSYKTILKFSEKGKPVDLSNTTLVLILKEDWKDDEDAEFVQILPEGSGKDSQIEVEIEGVEERGKYTLYVKSLDGDKRFTLSEIPVTIK